MAASGAAPDGANGHRKATAQGYEPVLHYIRVPPDTAIAQASERSARATAYAHDLDGAAVRHLASIFEEPADDEGILLQIPAPVTVLAILLGLLGIGLGAYIPANNAEIMSAVQPSHAATAGGMVNLARGIGTALGVAIVTLALPHAGDRTRSGSVAELKRHAELACQVRCPAAVCQ